MTIEELKLKASINLENPKGVYVDLSLIRRWCKIHTGYEISQVIKYLFGK